MISILSLIKDKSLWLTALTIIVLFFSVPYFVFQYSYFVLAALLVITVYFAANNKIGFSTIIFAFVEMLPNGEFHIAVGYTYFISYVLTFACWLILSFKNNKERLYNFTWLVRVIPAFILLSIYFAIKNDSSIEIIDVIYLIISTTMFFYISLRDQLNLKQFFIILDIIFYLTAFYVVKEIILHNSPYDAIYVSLTKDFQVRAKGLMGHPLILSSFLSFYNVALILKGYLLKKWDIFNFCLLVPLAVLCASKTVLVLIAIAWVWYIIFSRAYTKIAFYVVAVMLLIAGAVFYPKVETLVSAQIDRIVNSNADQRLGSYSVAMQVFSNNYLVGIGVDRDALRSELSRAGTYQRNSNYDINFLIFDNAYLTAFTSYGMLGLLIFFIYFHPVYINFRYLKNKSLKVYWYAISLVFLLLMTENISFDSFFHFPVNSFYFLLIAVIIKELRQHEKLNFLLMTSLAANSNKNEPIVKEDN